MRTNDKLHKAKAGKNDEFYTLMTDIDAEIPNYREQFKGMKIYCPCDTDKSNFVKFFAGHYEEYGLKGLVATSLNGERLDYVNGKLESTPMLGDGDFRSEECLEIAKEADIIVTNPPFSLFRDFVKFLEESYGGNVKGMKKHLIISTLNAFTYKCIFPYVMEGKEKLGMSITTGARWFEVDDDYVLKKTDARIKDGKKQIRINGVRWLTNLEIGNKEGLELKLQYRPDLYDFYDDFPEAINVDKLTEIPADYQGIMGVPITILDKVQNDFRLFLNDDEYEILGMMNNGKGDYDLAQPKVNGKVRYKRIAIRKKTEKNIFFPTLGCFLFFP